MLASHGFIVGPSSTFQIFREARMNLSRRHRMYKLDARPRGAPSICSLFSTKSLTSIAATIRVYSPVEIDLTRVGALGHSFGVRRP